MPHLYCRDPKSPEEKHFVVGSMGQPRGIDVFMATPGGGVGGTGACPYNRPCAHQYAGQSQSCMVISGRLIVHAPVALGGGGEGGLCRTDRRVCHQWHHGLGIHETTAVGVHTRGEHGGDRVLRVRSIVCTNMGSKCPSRSTS